MKKSEMNKHQIAIYDIMDEYTRETIGGYENTLYDYSESDPEYIEAKKYLNKTHEEMAEDVYYYVMRISSTCGNAQHAKFAGSQFLRDIIEDRLKEWKY